MHHQQRRNAVDGTPSPLSSPTLGPTEARARAYSMVPDIGESLLNLFGLQPNDERQLTSEPRSMREILAEIDARTVAIPEAPVEHQHLQRSIGMPDVRVFGK